MKNISGNKINHNHDTAFKNEEYKLIRRAVLMAFSLYFYMVFSQFENNCIVLYCICVK